MLSVAMGTRGKREAGTGLSSSYHRYTVIPRHWPLALHTLEVSVQVIVRLVGNVALPCSPHALFRSTPRLGLGLSLD